MYQGTWLSEQREGATETVGVLIYVMCYTAPERACSIVLPILGTDTWRIEIGRAGGISRATLAAAPPEVEFDSETTRVRAFDPYQSTTHAVVRRSGGVDFVDDAGSRHGTFVAGRKIASHLLEDGDAIEIGSSLWIYRRLPLSAVEELMRATRRFELGPTATFCPELRAIIRDLERIAPTSSTVTFAGETGVGKEIAAEHLHSLRARAGAFVGVNCPALPRELVEAELFGHEKGAYSGAASPREGHIVRADGGSLLLDELGSMPTELQAKLLRVIETGELWPLGAVRPRDVDVRWMAATNEALHDDSRLRPDLRYRLSGLEVHLPPLRRRREDLGEIVAHALAGAQKPRLSRSAGRLLATSPLEGNLRELVLTLQRAVALAAGERIEPRHLQLGSGGEEGASPRASEMGAYSKCPAEHELVAALERAGGNVAAVGRRLDIPDRTVRRWIEKLNIDLASIRRKARSG